MSTPTFEYENNGYAPELLEQYLKRFEELLSGSQLSGVKTGGNDTVEEILREVLRPGGSLSAQMEINQQNIYGSSGNEVQGGQGEPGRGFGSFRSIISNEYSQSQNLGGERSTEILQELQVKLEDLIRAIEQNTEQLSQQEQSSLDLND